METSERTDDSKLLDDIDLNENDLSNEAKHMFPFHTEILESLNYSGHSIRDNHLLSAGGKHIAFSTLMHNHNNIKSILNYLAAKPLETEQKISDFPMIVICGLPRTGTTLLYNLMACDLSCRAPFSTDMTKHPIPPILRSNFDEHKRRTKRAAATQAKVFEIAKYDVEKFRKNFSSSHPSFPIEEDSNLHLQAGIGAIYVILAAKEANFFTWFINQQNKDFAYRYHKTVLQMLHDVDPPRSHWLLKSSLHLYYIDTFLKYYPQASMIVTHRRIDQVLPSLYSLWLSHFAIYYNEDELTNLRPRLDEIVPASIDIRIKRLIEIS